MKSTCWAWTVLAACSFLLGAAGGCQKSRYERVIVEGTVTYNGQPLDKGKIRFYPIKGTTASLSGGDIVDGKYRIDRRGGVPVGTHQVRIMAYDVPDGPRVSLTEASQYLPAKYNSRSELEITIPPDSNEIVKSFDLVD